MKPLNSAAQPRSREKSVRSRKESAERSPRTEEWTPIRSYIFLTALVLLCLVPFLGKAFHADDTLFVWAGQQIAKHPLDPYGFNVVWYTNSMPMSAVTKNPPLASYYIALVASIAGWSERAMHIAFLLPAIVTILGVHSLARRFTSNALFAATLTLLTPGFLVSSSNVMCDTMMLAFWILAVILWLEGLDRKRAWPLIASAVLIAVCAVTKYFGMALIPLLLAYSIARYRKPGWWALYFLIPVVLLAGYQHWTHVLYGRGLLSDAAQYATTIKVKEQFSPAAKLLIGLGFAGGCVLPAIALIPVLWWRQKALVGCGLAALAGVACALGWITIPAHAGEHWSSVSAHLAFFITGGLSVIVLAVADWWKRKDAESLLLGLWVLGTLIFASFVNWTMNARSILPMIPAVGILIARHPRLAPPFSWRSVGWKMLLPLAVCGILSIMLTRSDAMLANSARSAAASFRDVFGADAKDIRFEGHWGFQYYMQAAGFVPLDVDSYAPSPGDKIIIPENNANTFRIRPEFVASTKVYEFETNAWFTTMNRPQGAGFYSAVWGPLPYAFVAAPAEHYILLELAPGGVEPQP